MWPTVSYSPFLCSMCVGKIYLLHHQSMNWLTGCSKVGFYVDKHFLDDKILFHFGLLMLQHQMEFTMSKLETLIMYLDFNRTFLFYV